jgi:hypothetical protein
VLLKYVLKIGVAFGEKSLIRGIASLLTKGHPYFQDIF